MSIILFSLLLATVSCSYIGCLVLAAAISYRLFERQFGIYFVVAFFLTFVFGGIVTQFWMWTGVF